MFGKLLKYDFTHYLKLWTVGAATALIMAAVGGFCQSQSPWLYRTDRVFLGLMFTLITVVDVYKRQPVVSAFTVGEITESMHQPITR